MFAKSEKIFVAYEKPEAPEPTDRVTLVRDGFSFWAFLLHIVWLLANRLWLAALGYVLLSLAIIEASNALHLSEMSMGIIQFGLQLLLGFNAHDLMGWTLKRNGYRFAGVIVAETPMHAQRRYYECAA